MGYFSSPHLVGCISPTFRGVTPARWLCLEQLRLFFCFRLDEEVFLQPMWGVCHSNSASRETHAYSQWAKTAYKDPSHLNSLPLSLSHTNTFILSSDVCLLQGGFWSDFLQTWGQIELEWLLDCSLSRPTSILLTQSLANNSISFPNYNNCKLMYFFHTANNQATSSLPFRDSVCCEQLYWPM